MKITAIIPTYNEEIHIADAITSVGFADEIIVIDSFSNDKTIEIAQQYDVKIIQRVFDDFSSQKNYAIEKATHDWIYILDADERVTPEVQKEILEAVQHPKDYVGFYVYRNFYFMNKKIKYSGWQRDKVIRLFLKTHCKYDGKFVHETIISKGNVGFFSNKIEHYSYRSLEHFIKKSLKYKKVQAEQMYINKKKATFFHMLIKPIARFVKHYIIKLGFLDGFAGFVLAIILSYGVFFRCLKLWLLNNKLQ